MPAIDLSILNQRQTPAFYADTLANRPSAGFIGRIFVSTNTFEFYRDNGTTWDLIGGPGTSTVTGTGANGQVTYWNGTSSITGSNDLFFDAVNGHFGVGTITPGTALDVKHNQNTVVQLEQETATNDTRIAFINSGVGLWRLGAFYNAGANDFGLFDIAAAAQPVTVKRTTGQVLIGTSTVGSGKLVVASATGDNGVQIVGASAPSLRIDNAESGPTKRAGFGISTATNNFIQGSADRDFCMFNGSTTASPILFGIYDTTNVQEAARISAGRNFIVGSTVDAGNRFQCVGSALITGATTISNALTVNSLLVGGTTSFTKAYIADTLPATSIGSNYNPGILNLQNLSATNGNLSLIGFQDASAFINLAAFGAINEVHSGSPNNVVGSLAFYTKPSGVQYLQERMRLNNAGNLLVNSVVDSGQRLQVTGTGYVTGNLGVGTSDTSTYRVNINNTMNCNGNTFLASGSGGVVIGDTTNPIGTLDIKANSPVQYFQAKVSITSGSRGEIGWLNSLGNGAATIRAIAASSDVQATSLQFLTRDTTGSQVERLTIKSTGVINISGIPTSAAGLVSGDIYSNLGVLTIVP